MLGILFSVNAWSGETSHDLGITNNNSGRATIGVMAHSDFVPDRTSVQKGSLIGIPSTLADRILEHLTNSQRFTPIERTALRRVILEQRFGKDLQKTYLDRTLDKAIRDMEKMEGGSVAGTTQSVALDAGPISGSVTTTQALEPKPVGGGIVKGTGDVGTTGALSDYNDILKDFQDLGTAVGAEYLVLGNLEKLKRSTKQTAVPYSTTRRTVQKNQVDARLQLRIIKVKTGTVTGAASIRTRVEEAVFEGKESNTDQFSFYDHLGRLAAVKVLDATFPARIVSVDPLVISRGTNDGIKVGDIYSIQREGKELKDANGLIIARLKSPVGQVEVVASQETVAIVKPIVGENFKPNDLASLDTEAKEALIQETGGASATALKKASPQGVKQLELPRVAIGLVKSKSTAETGKDANKHTPLFTDTIISRLTQTKRFQLIDRQEVDQLLDEQLATALAENKDMSSAMGNLKGADYLVYGSLASFSIEDEVVKLPNSSRVFKRKIGHVEGNMRIVSAQSGDIVESRKISIAQPIEENAKGTRVATTLADAYAEQVVLMLMNAIYPIKIAHVGGDGTVYINRGDDGGLFVGEQLNVYRPGKAIIDPDTGVQLGVEETQVGQVVVEEVGDARSKGKLTSGVKIENGYLLKRMTTNKGKRSSVASKQQKSSPARTGGVLGGNGAVNSATSSKQAASITAKPTILVGELKLNPSARTTGFGPNQLKRMTDEFIVKLNNSDRFTVMERQEVDQILDEKGFEAIAKGGDITDRIRELLGADYLIHGEVTNFYIDTKKRNVPYLNKVETTANSVTEGIFRIVDVHTGKVIAGDKVRLKKKIRRVDDLSLVMSGLIDEFSTKSVAKIVDRLYPVRVLGISENGVVYLNRGEDAGMGIGDRFNVMRMGQELIDIDTGRSYGAVETKMALIEVTAVEPNRSRASIVSGSDIQGGDILRKTARMKAPKPQVRKPNW